MKRTLTLCFLAVGAAAAAVSPAPAEARRPPTFGAAIDAVNLNVSVTDSHNRYVTDLGQDDFSVFENGVAQQLTLFRRDDVPISLALMIDGSSSMRDKLRSAQEAAVRFTRELRPRDSAEVIEFNERATTLQPFTSEHAAIEAAIRKTTPSGTTALHTALYVTLKDLVQQEHSAEPRRQAVVLLTDGEDTASAVSDEQVLELARKSEISVYAVRLQTDGGGAGNSALPDAGYLLKSLANETGGRAYFPTQLREIDSVYGRIAQELRTLYTVGYASSSPVHDGKWRRILVRLTRRAGLTVRHKIGYYAPVDRVAGGGGASDRAAEASARPGFETRPQ
jgi:Ca-activated chloride channel family protein